MREIKFRAWNERKNEWVHTTDGACNILGEMILIGGWMHTVKLEELNDIIVEQFTGLSDKNGKEIYEGDIYISTYRAGGAGSIRGRAKERIRQVVEWDDRGRWGRKRIEQGRGYGCCHPNCELGEDIEVIGNIHENPELLNGQG